MQAAEVLHMAIPDMIYQFKNKIMDLQLFREADGIYFHIQLIEKQKIQLWILKDQIIDLIESNVNLFKKRIRKHIPEPELISAE